MWLEPAEMKRPAMPAGDAVMAGLPANSVSKGKGRVPVGYIKSVYLKLTMVQVGSKK
jgi:hypothetical protein